MGDGAIVSATAYPVSNATDVIGNNYSLFEFDFTHCYQFVGIVYNVFSDVCCQSSSVQNILAPNAKYRIEANVDLSNANIYSRVIQPNNNIVETVVTGDTTFKLSIYSEDEGDYTCALQTDTTGPPNQVYPSTYTGTRNGETWSISITPDCYLTTTNVLDGEKYAVNVLINNGIDAVSLDFTVQVVNSNSYAVIADIIPFGSVCNAIPTLVGDVSGGIGPFSYIWNDVVTSDFVLENTLNGDNTLVVVDRNGVTSDKVTYNVALHSVPTLTCGDPCAATSGCDQDSLFKVTCMLTGSFNFIPATLSLVDYQNNVVQMSVSTPGSYTFTNVLPGTYLATFTDNGGTCSTPSQSVTVGTSVVSAEYSVTRLGTSTDIVCNNGKTNVLITPTGGCGGPYLITWSNSEFPARSSSSPEQYTIKAGDYTVTVQDRSTGTTATGCSFSFSFSVTQPMISFTVDEQITSLKCGNVVCNGDSNGKVIIVVDNDVNADIDWTNFPSGQSVSGFTPNNLEAGAYAYTVTDTTNECYVSEFLLTEPSVLDIILDNNPVGYTCGNTKCKGETGFIEATLIGGCSPITTTWAPTNPSTITSNDLNPGDLNIGTYYVTVTDANGCSHTRETELDEVDTALSASHSFLCPSDSFGGSITVTPTGGCNSYSIRWDHLSATVFTTTDFELSNLPANTYRYTVRDSNLCEYSNTVFLTSFTVSEQATSLSCGNVMCYGDDTGEIVVTVVPAAGAIITWTKHPEGQLISGFAPNNLIAGTYAYTVTNPNGCFYQSSDIVLMEPTLLSATFTTTCPTETGGGSVTIIPTGGCSDYSITWDDSSSTSFTLTNLYAGTYLYVITDSNRCEYSNTVALTALTGTTVITPLECGSIVCNGDSNGEITVTANPAAGAMITWDKFPSGQLVSGFNPTNLKAGTYAYSLSTPNGCSFQSGDIVVVEPPVLSATYTITSTCTPGYSGSITVTPAGGCAGYTISWDHLSSTVFTSTDFTVTGLSIGDYPYTVRDANGCEVSDKVILSKPSVNERVTSLTCDNVVCNGDSNGQITVTVTPAAGATISWTKFPSGQSVSGSAPANLKAGTYAYTVSNSNGCFYQSGDIVLTEPSPLLVSLNGNPSGFICGNTKCKGEKASIVATLSGGCNSYNTVWSNSNPTPIGNNVLTPGNLDLGTYAVTVTDANGCSRSTSTILTEVATALSTSFTTSSTCTPSYIGTITVTATGGCTGYTIRWDHLSPTVFTTTDFTVTGLSTGSYRYTVRDANGCETSTPVILTTPTVKEQVTPLNCGNAVCNGDSNGQITVVVTPAAGVTISWTKSPPGQSVSGFTPNDLVAGTYAYTLSNSNGCFYQSGDIVLTEPSPLSITLNGNPRNYVCGNTKCKGDEAFIVATPSGGCNSYNTVWSNSNPTPISDNVLSSGNLALGTYTATVTDKNGCSRSASTILTEVTTALSATHVTTFNCPSANYNGVITVSPSGGCAGYTIRWDHLSSTVFTTTDFTITGLPPGTYRYTVKDANECEYSETTTLDASTLTVGPISWTCGTLAPAPITTGTGPYTYAWTTNSSTTVVGTTLNHLYARVGLNTLTVTDSKGCQASSSYTISFPVVNTGLVDITQWRAVSGSWSLSPNSATLSPSGASGVFILATNLVNTVTPTISGKFTTPSSSNNDMIGLIVGYDATNTAYYLLEWRGTVTSPCGGQQKTGIFLLRVPTLASECDIATRSGGVVELQQSNMNFAWSIGTTHSFILSYTGNYVLLDLNGSLVISYWFQNAERSGLQNGVYAIVAASQQGLQISEVATDVYHKSCPLDGKMSIQKAFTSDTSCSVGFSISWGDGTTTNAYSKPYTLNAAHQGMSELFSHTYPASGSYSGMFCMTSVGYTHCDPFKMLIAEWFVADNNFQNDTTWYMYQRKDLAWIPSTQYAPARPVNLELWNESFTEKIQDAANTTTQTGRIRYPGTSGISPSDYKLHMYWQQGDKKCPFLGSPVDVKVRIAGNTKVYIPT